MTATATKPKAPRTIWRTTLNASGTLEHTISQSAADQLVKARDLCKLLKQVHEFQEEAGSAYDGLHALLVKAKHEVK